MLDGKRNSALLFDDWHALFRENNSLCVNNQVQMYR